MSNNDRFTRIRVLLGEEVFNQLRGKSVTIVGLGAVGGHAMEGLARAGINNITLVDFDIIQPSNINRQILALENTVGRSKAEVARERVLAINPDCNVTALKLFAGEESMEEILGTPPDLLIDAIDSLNPKTQLLAYAYKHNIPTISSMGAALRTDPSKIETGDLFSSRSCPLAKHLRKRLRRQEVGKGITCVYSTEPVDFEYQKPTEEPADTPYAKRGRTRNILGSLPTITGIFGLYLANEAIAQLTRQSDTTV
jgi:tRNA threonylcarbamoyladenosine dehydratase